MSMVLIAYPKIIYVQATEPTDKTSGRLWQDTDDNKLYSADGSAYNPVGASPNKSRGILPTQTGSWVTTPTNLSNATDGDRAVPTGYGSVGNSFLTGYFNFDFGAIYAVNSVYLKTGDYYVTEAGTIDVEYSEDNSNWTNLFTQWTPNLDSESVKEKVMNDDIIYMRYIRIKLYRGSSSAVEGTRLRVYNSDVTGF